jgi:dTDP-4-dehydrorhamnose reductase
MNILVTGSRGQLGSELKELSTTQKKQQFFFYDLPELDITSHDLVDHLCHELCIDVIVNCAAYTAVDKAETDTDAAFRVNRDGSSVLAACAKARNILLVHISTDYVFNGDSCVPYREIDKVSPRSVYGISKWEGEEQIRQIAPSYLIIRTSWLYSAYGSNFVKTMLRLGAERDTLNVVVDQVGTPTYAADLAEAIIMILERCNPAASYQKTYHYSNEGVASWYDFALAIMDISELSCRVLPVESAHYPQIAPRPHYSVLNKSSFKQDWGVEIPHWRASLALLLAKIKSTGKL